jgi:PAS domain S-box-containing protein
MIELLAADFGVEPLEDDGKRVWFRLGAAPGSRPDAPTHHNIAPGSADSTLPVKLMHLPIALYIAWQQHAEALLREATLSAFDDGGEESHQDFPLATRALGALADATSRVFTLRDQDEAIADITVHIDADAVPFFPILRELLATATQMSRAGQLLVPPSLPEIIALRQWVCDEIARQSAGLDPTPWSDFDIVDDSPQQVAATTLAEIREADEAVMAADSSNRIIAVSHIAADLLGWEVDDLEGRRLVAIMPARMRDRHVAGFTRYLLEGTSDVLGRPYATKALHRDGHEIDVTLFIERHDDPATRALFVARLVADDN